ncbi:MAG: cytochrome c5 [Pseudomonadales bacterium]
MNHHKFQERVVKFRVVVSLFVSALFLVNANAQEMTDNDIAERIHPVGRIHVAGAAPAVAVGPRTGKQIYDGACVACHTSGVLGAPKLQVAAEWQPRLDEKGFDQIWKNAISGINAMPAMGACGDCSDEDIKTAINYMIEGI